MQQMKFSRLSLLSQKEKRGLQIDFASTQTAIVAGNGFGKSAILKSLYETLGAKPHKIDKSWSDAQVTSLLEFSIDGKQFTALKLGDNFTIYDDRRRTLVDTNRITSELGPYLADLLNFHLVLVDKKDEIKTPPPSYAFAPYYVDQDRSWQKPWDSFKDLNMFSNSARSLAEYHSGLKPNAYYDAKAARDRIGVEIAKIEAERRAIDQALHKVREGMKQVPLSLDLSAFSAETDRLVAESQALHDTQARYRAKLAGLNEEAALWHDHISVVESALRELDDAFTGSLDLPTDVECPMCGQHYHNHIVDQFELKADQGDLLLTLQSGHSHLKEVMGRIQSQRQKLDEVASALGKVDEVMAVHKQDITLRDVVAAEGQNEAQRFLRERLGSLDTEHGEKQRLMQGHDYEMKESESRERTKSIRLVFSKALTKFAYDLDVRLPDTGKLNVQGLHIGRGSEGPRALAAYYYAFLHTAREHGSSTFCPIVIDAPNQQGQDQAHLRQMMEFLLAKMPIGSQVIIGVETLPASANASVIDVSWKKDQVLREDAYEETLRHLQPYLRSTEG